MVSPKLKAKAKPMSGGEVRINASGHAADGLTVTLYGDNGIRIMLPGKFAVTRVQKGPKDNTHVAVEPRADI